MLQICPLIDGTNCICTVTRGRKIISANRISILSPWTLETNQLSSCILRCFFFCDDDEQLIIGTTIYSLLVFVVKRCVENGGEKWHTGKSKVVNRVEMEPDTTVSLLFLGMQNLRAVNEFAQPYFYLMSNSYYLHKTQSKTRLQGRRKRVAPPKKQCSMDIVKWCQQETY